MTTITASSTSASRVAARRRTVDVFGVAWPRHKAESVAAALAVFILGAVLTLAVGAASFVPAILVAAAVGAGVWWASFVVNRRGQ